MTIFEPSDRWYLVALNRNPGAWIHNTPFYGDHGGSDCAPPAADGQSPTPSDSFLVQRIFDWFWVCFEDEDRSHLMLNSASSDGYGASYATPAFEADWSSSPVVISWERNIGRLSGRSWMDVSITTPELWVAQLWAGAPAQGSGPAQSMIRITDQVGNTGIPNTIRVERCLNFSCSVLSTINTSNMALSRRTRVEFVLTIDGNSAVLEMPEYGVVKSFLMNMPFGSGLVTFASHNYNSGKAVPTPSEWSATTTHLDDVYISNGQPFKVTTGYPRIVGNMTASQVVNFTIPSEAGDRLFCSYNSTSPQVRLFINGSWGGWQTMQTQPLKDPNTARWLDRDLHNLPAGVTAAEFRSPITSWHGDWAAANCAIFDR